MEPFVIRPASLDDVESIAQCHKEAIEKKAAGFYGADVITEWSWRPDRLERVRSEIQNADFIYLVASSGNDILGYGIANPTASELKSLCAKPNKKGRVGVSLLAALIAQCKQRGCTYLELSSSLNAEAFYLDNGFRVLERGEHRMESGAVMACVKMRTDFDSSGRPE